MDHDGIPLAFDIYPGNKNEQPTLKPLEKKVIRDYGMEQIIVCTDAGLSSKANRKFNDKIIDGIQIRSFITTQSVKQLPEYLKEFALDPEGWHLPGSSETFCLDEIDEEADYHKVFYKDRWIKEDLSQRKIKNGAKPLEQHLIVSFSPKYQSYQRKIRKGQIDQRNGKGADHIQHKQLLMGFEIRQKDPQIGPLLKFLGGHEKFKAPLTEYSRFFRLLSASGGPIAASYHDFPTLAMGKQPPERAASGELSEKRMFSCWPDNLPSCSRWWFFRRCRRR